MVAAAAVAALLPLLTGCGDETAPSDSVPALARDLDAVDAAIEDGSTEQARAALERLVDETERARTDGRLSDDEAAAITRAAAALLERLPEPATPPATDPPDPTPPAETEPSDDGEEGGEGEGPESHGNEGHGKGSDNHGTEGEGHED